MYRQIFIPNEQNNHVSIPHSWYGHEVEVIVFLTDKMTIPPKIKPRYNWAESAQQMHTAGGDTLLMPSVSDNENIEWWTWNE